MTITAPIRMIRSMTIRTMVTARVALAVFMPASLSGLMRGHFHAFGGWRGAARRAVAAIPGRRGGPESPVQPGGSAEVDELQVDVEVGALEERDRRLQVVAALRLDSELVALDLALDGLRGLVADDLPDLLRVLLVDALLELDDDAVLAAARLRLARVQALQRDPALDDLGLED